MVWKKKVSGTKTELSLKPFVVVIITNFFAKQTGRDVGKLPGCIPLEGGVLTRQQVVMM